MPFIEEPTSPSRRWPQARIAKFGQVRSSGTFLQSARATGRRAIGYLKMQAVQEPRAFLSLLGELLPTQITGEDGDPVRITQIELVPLERQCGKNPVPE